MGEICILAASSDSVKSPFKYGFSFSMTARNDFSYSIACVAVRPDRAYLPDSEAGSKRICGCRNAIKPIQKTRTVIEMPVQYGASPSIKVVVKNTAVTISKATKKLRSQSSVNRSTDEN